MGDIDLINFIFAWSNGSSRAFPKTGQLICSPFNGYLVTGTVIKHFTNVQNVGLAMYQQYIVPISILAPSKTTILQWIRITLSYLIIGFPMCRRVHKNLDIFKFNSWGLVCAKEMGYSRKIQTGWVEDILFWTSIPPLPPLPLGGWYNLNFLELKDCNSIVIYEKIVRRVTETLLLMFTLSTRAFLIGLSNFWII